MPSPHRTLPTRAIFFDFDGVLTRDQTGSLTTLSYLSEKTGVGLGELQAAFKKYNTDLNLGRVTHREVWTDVCNAIGRPIDEALLLPAFESTPMNAGMLELARALKEHYFVGIITDNKQDRIDHLKVQLGLAALFDPIVVSAEVGSSKKGSLIFQHALSYLGIAPSESIFIDNSEENLVAPRALGMNTVHFDDEKNDVQALVATLKEVYGVHISGAA